MRAELAEWADAIPEAWRETFARTFPDVDAPSLARVQDEEFRQSHPPLQSPDEGPQMFQAFRHIKPKQVRVFAIGQDPYPERDRATGRAFEDGAADLRGIAISLRRVLQSALTAMDPALEADRGIRGWDTIRGEIGARLTDQAAVMRYFDGLAGQGVLFLNAAWTFTEIEWHLDAGERKRRSDRVQNAHRALWRPVTSRVINRLAARDGAPVFLLFGKNAWNCFRFATRHLQEPPTSVFCAHPTARRAAYFDHDNPLRRTNQALELLDRETVQWWPPMAPDE